MLFRLVCPQTINLAKVPNLRKDWQLKITGRTLTDEAYNPRKVKVPGSSPGAGLRHARVVQWVEQ